MTSVQKAVFPGTILGILFLILVASLISAPHAVMAYNAPADPASTLAAQLAQPTAAGPVDAAPAPVENSAESQSVQGAAQSQAQTAACSIAPSYPDSILQWCSFVERYAQENNIEPNLIAAVMLQESGGNPDAYSKSGAVGLLQVMPRDGKSASFMCKNGPCFADRPSTEELYDPEFNISYGAHMLADLIQKSGSVRDALRSYGPMDMGYRYADIILSIFERYR